MSRASHSSRQRSAQRNRKSPRPYRLRLETLEQRLLLATFTVNSTGDQPDINPGNGICETTASGGVCTLRAAIQEANALANSPAATPDLIGFGIGASDPRHVYYRNDNVAG